MIEIVDLDADLRQELLQHLPADVLPTAHPIWFNALAHIGEDVHGFAARRDGRIEGWLLYTLTQRDDITVASSLPYLAYAGLYATDAAIIVALLKRYRAVDADVVSLGTSPLISASDEETWRDAFAPTHAYENFVQLHELTSHPLEQLAKKRRDAFGSELRRAAAAGLRVMRALDAPQMDAWLAIYRARYATIGATPYPDAFHRAVHEIVVPAGAAEIWGVVDDDSRLRGGIVFLISHREVTYFSSAFDEEARHAYATTFLLDEAFRSFLERGVRTFNWQSSPGRGGVFEFKKRWGAREHRHFYFSALKRADSPLFRMKPEDLRAVFPLRFVLPYSAWSTIAGDAR